MQRQGEETARVNIKDPRRPHCVVVFVNGDREQRSGCLKVLTLAVFGFSLQCTAATQTYRQRGKGTPAGVRYFRRRSPFFSSKGTHRVVHFPCELATPRTRNDPVRRSFSKVVTGTGCGNAVGIGLQSERVSTDNPGVKYTALNGAYT